VPPARGEIGFRQLADGEWRAHTSIIDSESQTDLPAAPATAEIALSEAFYSKPSLYVPC
jgi:hypothetical protein